MRTLSRLASLLLPALLPALPHAAEQPLWEAGVGVAALSFPAYRGSDQRSNFVMPIPYFTYHGDFLKADRHGVRGSLFDTDRVKFTVSGALSPPASSSEVTARKGMPNLKATAEVGPQLDVTLWRAASRARFLKLRLPVRAAFTVDAPPQSVGLVFQPQLNLDVTDLPSLPGWNLGFLAGPVYADRRFNHYYYSVDSQYATASRPAYQAQGGYAGMQYLASLSKHYPNHWVGAFVRYDNLAGASFGSSPLVKQKEGFAFGVAVSWILGRSATLVTVDD